MKKKYKDIPLIGLDGVAKNRRREFWKDQMDKSKRRRPMPTPTPFCGQCIVENRGKPERVRLDGFGRPLKDCATHALRRVKDIPGGGK